MDLFGRLIDWIISIWEFFIPFVVIREYEKAVILRLGKFHRTLDPGFHWVVPFNVDEVHRDVVVLRLVNLPAQSLTTKDGKTVVIGGVARISISDIRKATLDVQDVDGAVRDACLGAIGELVEESTWDEMLEDEFKDGLLAYVRNEVREFGVKVKSVKLSDKAASRAYRFHVDQFNTFKAHETDGVIE